MREINRLETLISLQISAVGERLTAETNLTRERFVANGLARDSIAGMIEDEVRFAAAARDSIKDELYGRLEGHRDLFNEKFSGVAQEHSALRVVLDERYATQTKALDAAFLAQQAAVATSFDASEKAMAAALLAAKEAVEKANTATEKRFDNVTELLAQQTAVQSLLLPRAEAEARLKALDDKVADIKSAVDMGFTSVDTRREGVGEGRDMRADSRGSIALWVAVASVALTLVLTIVTTIHLGGGH